ncbi:MAG: shikimate dehydrogenase [Saprospiraceae bacterium]|jgi:shikimate dehydrogenase
MMKQFGLIGYPLTHSFSPNYFNQKFDNEDINAEYMAYPLETITDYCALVEQINFVGLNVTIPYKESIISFLDEIDEVAHAIGAVNTITFEDGVSKGYNTDAGGFRESLLSFIGDLSCIKSALILGNGGAAKAVKYVLKCLGIKFKIVSRSGNGDLTYDDLGASEISSSNLIINTTPLGMYPNVAYSPKLPYNLLDEKYFLFDLVYNPEKTIFLTEGLNRGCKIKNGHEMLILQAEYAWHIWNHH